MIRLELLGAHTRVHATLCFACPQGPAGCCASPPGVEWSDLGRIVTLGGAAWILEQITAGNLVHGARALNLRRREADALGPRRCVFHQGQGCTIPADRRAATCNFYVCDDAFAREDKSAGDATAGREAVDLLMDTHGRWDLEIAERVQARFPGGLPWDITLLAWLGEEYLRLSRRDRRKLRSLAP
ncbi:MAG: hypothetical protein ABJE95_31115 [Byssovorax sp.]